MMAARMENIFTEEKTFEIDGPDRVSASIEAFLASNYLIIHRRTKVGHYLTGGLGPSYQPRKNWYLEDDLSVDWAIGMAQSEMLRFIVIQADQWFETVSLECGKFNRPD